MSHAMEASEGSSARFVPICLPPGVSPDCSVGKELTDILLTIITELEPKWGIKLATDLAHFCVIELDQESGFELFKQLAAVSFADIQRAEVLLMQRS